MQNSWRSWCFEDGDCSASVLSEKLRACLRHVVVGVPSTEGSVAMALNLRCGT